ncbi:hypothetical protein IFM89_039390 [Coptis chinensis]|uniref:Uncharacterized protein n=1 Tax=Coptis chinensis TaxID=261450 RepID=A0A835I8P4_9MAGN|nr:hypothetical protein IFM89_039390 [Coptis chinensis]
MYRALVVLCLLRDLALRVKQVFASIAFFWIISGNSWKVMDHINTTKGFTLEHLHYLVVDETGPEFKIKKYSASNASVYLKQDIKGVPWRGYHSACGLDAMTRGMGVEGVRTLINYDVPAYIKRYVHRKQADC